MRDIIFLKHEFDTEKYNLFLYNNKDLFDVCTSERYSEEIRLACLTELLIRKLNAPYSVREDLNSLLTDDELKQLELLFNEDFLQSVPNEEKLQKSFWQAKNAFSMKCQILLRERLTDLFCQTHGFIPVYFGEDAFFIPFHFEEGTPQICNIQGEIIESWQEKYPEAIAYKGYKCTVHCSLKSSELTGSSFMLPVYLALQRKLGFLKYNLLQLITTGTIENNRIAAVETKQKAQAVQNKFPFAYFFFPESTTYLPKNANEIPLPIGMNLDRVLEHTAAYIEAKNLYKPSFRDALVRLQKIDYDCIGNYNKWEMMLERIDNNAKVIPAYRAPENYLLCLMLKSAVYCHMGDSTKALKLNREAKEFAEKNGFEKQLLRLEIEELVEFQDQEKFDIAAKLAEPLKENIEKLDDADLLMRYYGTMGQAHSYGYLAKNSYFSKDIAKNYFLKALQYAVELESEADIAQDLNYNLLWYALFEPENIEVSSLIEDIREHINRNLDGNIQSKNEHFFRRTKAFLLYRSYLSSGEVPDFDAKDILLPEDAEFWLKAVTNKYVGALYAASGRYDDACKLFAEAAKQLGAVRYHILRFIYMTVLAEAYRSLGDEKYKKEALQIADELAEMYPDSIPQWRAFLTSNAEFPGMNYWY